VSGSALWFCVCVRACVLYRRVEVRGIFRSRMVHVTTLPSLWTTSTTWPNLDHNETLSSLILYACQCTWFVATANLMLVLFCCQ